MSFVARCEHLLLVSQNLLDLSDLGLVSGVLTDVIANLYCRTTCSRAELDHNVEWNRFLPRGLLLKVVYRPVSGYLLSPIRSLNLLVKKVPIPKLALNPAFSAACLYLIHKSTFSESENTIVFLSLMLCCL